MPNQSIQVEYHEGLASLDKLLSKVRRCGDFFVEGRLETPLPKLEVDGAGVLSFPVPDAQARQLIAQAERAPYGRGEETILDESVRKVWQLPPAKVRIGGKSWPSLFENLLRQVATGLGCDPASVSAELYKLLVYDQGGFFKAHRDTEKAEGMFATLVVVLPSAHRGGELVVRHAGREVTVDLSATEPSELAFAAFYADCEHEVRPITEGNRVCLVYNLIQQRGAKKVERGCVGDQPQRVKIQRGSDIPGVLRPVEDDTAALRAPLYDAEVAAAAECLREAFGAPEAPAKIVWLLEHQYSPDGLSFAGLKNADAARAKVLAQAAERADCASHLGIVHIEEYGPAEPKYHRDYGYGRRSRWRGYKDEETKEDVSSDDFEVIEVSDGQRYIDQWVDAGDRRVDFGKLPLGDGELLPHGALDDEKPDQQRLTEATGNEGASFERSYHRAALVIWPRDRYAGVLLQAGISAALPHLRERIAARDTTAPAIAEQIIEAWENPPSAWAYRSPDKEPSRADMLRLLQKLGDEPLVERFIGEVVTRDYDGSENESLAASVKFLGPKSSARLLVELFRQNMTLFHRSCVDLLSRIVGELCEQLDSEWRAALEKVAAIAVETLPGLKPAADPYASPNWQRTQKAKPVDAAMVAELLEALRGLGATARRTQAAAAIAQNTTAFDPANVIVPALTLLHDRERKAFPADPDCGRLWVHAADFLLARSEQPPAPPTDWRQPAALSCKCEDCRALQAFARDAEAQVARFRMHQGRRSHVENQIRAQELDISCKTDTQGRPQTLVCTKTRRTYQRQCKQHEADCRSMNALLDVMRPPPEALAELAARLATAKERRPGSI
jgi:hypothetical protein